MSNEQHNEDPSWVQLLQQQQNIRAGKNEMPPPPTDDEKNIKNKAFQQHLKEWQKKHNLLADDENDNSVQVLFGDVWQQTAEDILSMGEPNGNNTVMLTPEEKLQMETAGENFFEYLDENTNQENTQAENNIEQPATQNKTAYDEVQDLFATPPKVSQSPSYMVKVVEPPIAKQQKVAVMDEKVLIEQLTEKLRPHLNQVIAGTVKNALQRYMSSLAWQLQHELPNELDEVVHDTLRLHLTQAMDDIKQQAGIE
ncbi:MAG: hypothetical protein IKZ88_01880 [Neisseriaceae bacterium]|nr:hypothetical protein [Neisseriaceae bacterium]